MGQPTTHSQSKKVSEDRTTTATLAVPAIDAAGDADDTMELPVDSMSRTVRPLRLPPAHTRG